MLLLSGSANVLAIPIHYVKASMHEASLQESVSVSLTLLPLQ
ncbi:hypothetical protein A359_07900 [secondary endosymbiont of Ctenarytaina eucalypti]|uniref:Uncharacterized protein n=1 Tax=secondary endosymbiont of Ctenarytaina eucalypti TaxID=1199245 RepID=J3Z4E3_9ENTR|nr:hypothetical protein A359_07900 [secondary endosymbiont of Ctenarytaina eucalypti]